MATLYDLAMQYLNQSLPKTFKYDRTPPIGINPPTQPGGPPEPIAKILPRPGGNEEGFSVYNPDPNRTRTPDQYSPYNYRTASEKSYIGAPGDYSYSSATEAQKMMDMYPEYYTGKKQLEGIPGLVQGYLKNSIPGKLIGNIVGGIENLLPVNRRAILENELLGQGFQLNDIGQFVSDGGNINTAENIMAGYNANKVTAETFQKRRDMINAKMSDTNINPKTGKTYKEEKLAALDEAERRFFEAKGITTGISDQRKKAKDPTYKSEAEKIIEGITAAQDDSGSDMLEGIETILDTKPKKITDRGRGENNISTPKTKTAPKGGGSDYGQFNRREQNKTTTKTTPKPSRPGPKTPISDRGRGQSNVSPKSKGPVSTKGQAGPPSQRGGGGGGGCFLKGTLITMFDGTKKPVEQVDLGNEVAIGGKVFATGKFLVKNLHDYKGIKVSGSHMVSENNKWVRVEDSEHGKLLGNEEHTVYVFGSENRRILINDILFTDYFEVNEQDKLMNNEEDFFDNWKLYAKQDSGNNVDIINAS